jgi:predicted DNA-binding protein (MmcQ/YjbR family)
LARAHWVSVRHWGVLRGSELEEQLKHGHSLIYGKLPKKTRDVLALPAAAQRKLRKERLKR